MQRIAPGTIVSSRPVTVTSGGKIKPRKRRNPDPVQQAIDKTPAGPLFAALDFGKKKKRKKAKKAKARKARNTRKRNAETQTHRYRGYDLLIWKDGRRTMVDVVNVHGATEFRAASMKGAKKYIDAKYNRASALSRQRNAKMSRFDRCVKSVTERGGAYDARAVCASAGRRKYGKKKFQAMAKAGKARAARKRARKR